MPLKLNSTRRTVLRIINYFKFLLSFVFRDERFDFSKWRVRTELSSCVFRGVSVKEGRAGWRIFIGAYAASGLERCRFLARSVGKGDTPAGGKGQGVLACSRSAHLRKVESR